MKTIQKEITPLSEEDLFIVLNHPSAEFDYSIHYHSDYEINLVLDTYGKRIIGDSEELFSSLDLVFIGPNIPHAWKGVKTNGNHVITIQFSESILDFPILKKRQFKQIKELLHDSKRGVSFPEETKLEIKKRILELTKTQGFNTILEFLSILHILSISEKQLLMDSAYDTESIARKSKSRRIEKVCNFIDNNYQKEIRLTDVSKMVNMSDSAFSHFFKKKTNSTFIDYLINIRIAKACQLLSKTTHTIGEVCFTCGFNNLSNFIRIFKKRKKCTPGEYRKHINQMLTKY